VVHSSTRHGPGDGPAVPSGPAVPEVLVDQHQRLRGLLHEVAASEGPPRREAFESFRRLLAGHETAEEVVVRPVSRQIMDRDMLTERNHEEHRIVQLLAELEKLDACGAVFEELLPSFTDALDTHLTLEETLEFPILEAELDWHDRTVMARWINRALALGPTHAHPGGFGSPMTQRAVTPFTALVDHARDAYGRAREHPPNS
jgi:Hemerythrin HHE cation binding domain